MVELFANEADFFRYMPFMDAPNGAFKYDREATLPGVAWRGINESYTQTTSVINPQIEQTFIIGGEIGVDRALIRRYGTARFTLRQRQQMKAITRACSNAYLFGDNRINPRQPDGLYNRLTGTNVRHNSTASGGAALSMQNLDRAIDACIEPTHIIANKAFRTRLTQAGRNTGVTGFVAQEKDDIGNLIMSYRTLPILVGYENDVDGTLIDFNESPSGGGTANNMSVFVVSMKEGHMAGIQVAPPEWDEINPLPNRPASLGRWEWDMGWVIEHPSAAIRLDSIADAPFTL